MVRSVFGSRLSSTRFNWFGAPRPRAAPPICIALTPDLSTPPLKRWVSHRVSLSIMLRMMRAVPVASLRLLQSTFVAVPSFVAPAVGFSSCRWFSSERGSTRSVGAVALNTLSPAPGSRRVAKRLGRGVGSGDTPHNPRCDEDFNAVVVRPELIIMQVRVRRRVKATKVKLRDMELLDPVLRAVRRRCIVAFPSAVSPIPTPFFLPL